MQGKTKKYFLFLLHIFYALSQDFVGKILMPLKSKGVLPLVLRPVLNSILCLCYFSQRYTLTFSHCYYYFLLSLFLFQN